MPSDITVNGARFPNPHGLPLFPLQANSKRPRQGDTEFWRAASPGANIPLDCNAGVITGNGLIVLDLDVKNEKDGIKALVALAALHDDMPATFTVETLTGGRHLYFCDPLGRDFGQGTDRLGPGIDVKAHSHGYVVAAGSVIDGRRYKIIDDRPIADAPEWLIDLLSRSAPRSRGTVDQVPLVELDTDENIELATAWLIDEAPEAIEGAGGDDTTAKRIAPKLKDFGLSPDMALSLAWEIWNPIKADPPWPYDELEKTILSGYRSATQNRPGSEIVKQAKYEFPKLPDSIIAAIAAQPAPKLLPAASGGARPQSAPTAPAHKALVWTDCIGAPPVRQWVWDGLIPHGHVTTLFGDGGTGKTILAQQLATVIAMPAERRGFAVEGATVHDGLFGHGVTPGRVLGLFCEDDNDELWRRQDKINAKLGLSVGDLTGFRAVSGQGLDNILMTFDRAIGKAQPLLKWLHTTCHELKPSLVIIDNIADTFGGSEIARLEANQFLKTCLGGIAREHNCAVLLLGHPSVTGMKSGTGISGSTAWSNGVRSRLLLRRLDTDDPNYDKDARTLDLMKANYAPMGDGMRLHWHNGTWAHVQDPSLHCASLDASEKQRLILETMTRIIAGNENMSSRARAGNYAVRRLLETNEIAALGMSKPQIARAIDALSR